MIPLHPAIAKAFMGHYTPNTTLRKALPVARSRVAFDKMDAAFLAFVPLLLFAIRSEGRFLHFVRIHPPDMKIPVGRHAPFPPRKGANRSDP